VKNIKLVSIVLLLFLGFTNYIHGMGESSFSYEDAPPAYSTEHEASIASLSSAMGAITLNTPFKIYVDPQDDSRCITCNFLDRGVREGIRIIGLNIFDQSGREIRINTPEILRQLKKYAKNHINIRAFFRGLTRNKCCLLLLLLSNLACLGLIIAIPFVVDSYKKKPKAGKIWVNAFSEPLLTLGFVILIYSFFREAYRGFTDEKKRICESLQGLTDDPSRIFKGPFNISNNSNSEILLYLDPSKFSDFLKMLEENKLDIPCEFGGPEIE